MVSLTEQDTQQQINMNKYEIALPKWVVENNTVFIAGEYNKEIDDCCMANGARSVSHGWVTEAKYDVVVCFDSLENHPDVYTFLERITSISSYAVVIDSLHSRHMVNDESPFIDVIQTEEGLITRTSPAALRGMMRAFGFQDKEGLLYPDTEEFTTTIKNVGSRTQHVPKRYLLRFINVALKSNKFPRDQQVKAEEPTEVWTIDEEYVKTYYERIEQTVPDYTEVIDLSFKLTKKIFTDKSTRILDIGSGRGATLEKFFYADYLNTYGTEQNELLWNRSEFKHNVFNTSDIPEGEWSVMFMNWTLRHIDTKELFLKQVYNRLSPNGMFIMTDKMTSTTAIELMYEDFMLQNGMTRQQIDTMKRTQLSVLSTRPLEWYLDKLKENGFIDVQVIHSKFMFNTIYARKQL